MNRRSFFRGAAFATLAVLAPLKRLAPETYAWAASKLTFSDLVAATLKARSADIAADVVVHNAVFNRLARKVDVGGYEIKGITVEELLCYGEQPAAFPHLAGTPANLDDRGESTIRRPDPPPSSLES